MILHPGILALVGGGVAVLFLTGLASALGVNILVRWDFSSSSEYQLSLERRTYLVSTLMNYVLGFEVLSALLYVYTVDDIHRLFVGAMCATGSLNANPVGWYALASKTVVLFASSTWIALNHIDMRAEDAPLVKLKYALLLLILPLVGLDLYLLTVYFLGLDPVVITSCCGSLFSESSAGVASSLASLPVVPAMIAFYVSALLLLVLGCLCLKYRTGLVRYVTTAVSVWFFLASLGAIVSFISVYIYELPTHHCPFDILHGEYHFLGYLVYGALLASVFFGALPGMFQPLKKIASLRQIIVSAERRWLLTSTASLVVFVTVSSWPVVFGSFTLQAYF